MLKRNDHRGFTLVEVIVTIIISAILAVLLMQIMKGHSWRSRWPMIKLEQGFALREVMEKISADHRRLIISDPTPLVTLQNRIANGGNPPNGYWSGQTYSAKLSVDDNYCLDLNPDSAPSPGEQNIQQICDHQPGQDLILKVTISYEGQSLTTLFTR
ncbi:MAG: type II secretion system protein [Desulfobacteraceae bacterium]|jgi:prepilin-type N-terminal cleavage/methylation domain-containing protein